jgi:O-antigen biosynthesis protein
VTALTHLVVGPDEHGVTRYALRCAEADGGPVVRVPQPLRLPALPALLRRLAARDGGAVHLHLTDHLLGRDPAEAAEVVHRISRRHRLTVTLHDLPQASDGRHHGARARCYARVVSSVRGAIVSSHHELELLREALHRTGDTLPEHRLAVVPHLVEPPAAPPLRPAPQWPPDVAVLGFVYPGKGHLEALRSLHGLAQEVGLVALGRASRGHQDLVDDLAALAGADGRRFACTGWVADDQLHRRLQQVAVPVVAHAHVSASGSLATWLSAGRRPVALRNRYVEEVEASSPGSLAVVDDLRAGVAAALADPASTWLPAGTAVGPDASAVAAAVARLVGRWAA